MTVKRNVERFQLFNGRRCSTQSLSAFRWEDYYTWIEYYILLLKSKNSIIRLNELSYTNEILNKKIDGIF